MYEAPQDEATLARFEKTQAIRLVGECGYLVGFFLMVAGICEKARDNHIIYQTKAKPNVGLH